MSKIFTLGMQPLANKYPSSVTEFDNEILRNMDVYYCEICNYLNLPCDINRSLFFEDYYYLSSVNHELVIHFNKLASYIKQRNFKFVVDIGSNDGILLKPLKELGVNCVGIEPSENVSAIANADGFETVVGFFTQHTTNHIVLKHGKPDLICASSVFTHLDNPGEFFELADKLLSDNGEIIIEVEYLGNILNTLGFERFYFDRPHYYSIHSLMLIAESNGYCLIEAVPINIHGGSIRAIFRRKDSNHSNLAIKKLIDNEFLFINYHMINKRFNNFKLECEILFKGLYDFTKQGLLIAGYGCPARLSTITNFSSIGKDLIPYVIEDSKLKQNRFSPGMHIPILKFSDTHKVDIFIVFAYEYILSIKEKIKKDTVSYYRPIPFKRL